MAEKHVDLTGFVWFNPPGQMDVAPESLEFVTSPDTDFWQRTHYGFRRNNGHALLMPLPADEFSFSIQTEFFYETLYDQAGILLYLDEEHWAKASIEFETESFGNLGSVVTNGGWSDWATTPIPTDVNRMAYRISRRGSDFLFECAPDGDDYQPMRVFHLLGDVAAAKVGLYACSPSESRFKARFTEPTLTASQWKH